MSKHDWIDKEIESMQLDRNWADGVRETARTIANYPQAIVYTPDGNIIRSMDRLSTHELKRSLNALCTNLREAKSQDEFAENITDVLYGIPEFDVAHGAFSEMYMDLYHRFYIQNNTMFAYKLRDYHRADSLFFTRLSELEIIEYALYCSRLSIAGTRSPSNVCGRGDSSGADSLWGTANWCDTRSIWSTSDGPSLPILPAGGIDSGHF